MGRFGLVLLVHIRRGASMIGLFNGIRVENTLGTEIPAVSVALQFGYLCAVDGVFEPGEVLALQHRIYGKHRGDFALDYDCYDLGGRLGVEMNVQPKSIVFSWDNPHNPSHRVFRRISAATLKEVRVTASELPGYEFKPGMFD